MNDKTFLDIDDTILRNNLLLNKNNHESEIDEILKHGFEPKTKSIIIHPFPGVCVKTKTDTGEKVFLNICTTTKIPPPEDISEEKLMSLYNQDTNDDSSGCRFSIPMSIGKERLEPDKGGTLCVTHDVAMNKNFFDKCQKQHFLWLFTMTVIIEGVSEKFGKSLDSKTFIVLKNRKVMGNIQPQNIDDRERRQVLPPTTKTLIEEISSSSNTDRSVTTSAKLQSKCQESATNNYVILKEPLEGIAKRLIGLFHIPAGVTTQDLNVFLDIDHIIVTTNENKFAYDIYVPYVINLDKTESFFDKDLRVLRLNMPIENV